MSRFTSYPRFEVSLHPSSVYTGWLPPSSATETYKDFFDELEKTVQQNRQITDVFEKDSPIKALNDFLTGQGKDDKMTETAKYLFDIACVQNTGLIKHYQEQQYENDNYFIPRIADAADLTTKLDALLNQSPKFYKSNLVGLPFSAVFIGVDATLSGSRCFGLPGFNNAMRDILNKWQEHLDSPASGEECFGEEGNQWLTPEAKKKYDFEIWKKDSETLPYWKSWNSFFTREFKDPKIRPIAAPGSKQIVCSPNDGQLFRWDANILLDDTFWLKDMNYSLREIFTSDDPAQQHQMDSYDLIHKFQYGYIFQTMLTPNNYHHWWAPVDGTVLFDPFVIPGVFFNKLVLPDLDGATTASLPYLVHVNSRGILVLDTGEYGLVCCIPIGMSEVSTVEFQPNIKKGASVKKGDEIGNFRYGGSSFAILFQKVSGKDLIFHSGVQFGYYPPRPQVPIKPTDTIGFSINIGQQIGSWVDATDYEEPPQ